MLRERVFLKLLLLAVCLPAAAIGAAASGRTGMPLPAKGDGGEQSISIDADSLSFEREHNLVRADGNVIIRHGDEVLHADRVVMHTGTRQAHASGNVFFVREDMEWEGERFFYDFSSRRWASGKFKSVIDPFYMEADAAENIPPEDIEMQRASVTTCELPMKHAHYRLRARHVRIRPDDHLLARHAMLYLGRIPIFYSPVWRASLDPDFGFRIEPGSSGRMGTYLLTSYRYRINPVWRGETHLDYRSRRGTAVGQDLRWDDPDDGVYAGSVSAYYLEDRDRYLDRDPETLDIDESRYRLQLRHHQRLTGRDSLRARLEYVSDREMREDFFERDYRRAVQPDNYVSYLHSRDALSFGLLARGRLNDFYEHVDRLPEATLDINRRRLGETPLYYDSRSAATVLRRRYAAGVDADDVAVNRIDTRHRISWPARPFRVFSLIPRVGGDATYYSQTFETLILDEDEDRLASDRIVGRDEEEGTVRIRRESGADVRTSAEMGLESSFQLARIWYTEPAAWGKDLRHVVEPYTDYTFIPEPSVTPDRLHRFDDTDRRGKAHHIVFGVRNVLQTKRERSSHDLLDVNLFSAYRLDTRVGEDALGDVRLRAVASPADNWGAELTAVYEPNASVLNELNSRLFYRHPAYWEANIDYRYRYERSRLLAGTLALMPSETWQFDVYGRYEAETSRLEEHAWYGQHNLDCMAIRVGLSHLPSHTLADGTERDDEYRITLEIWLTAFPERRSEISRRH